MHRAAITTLHMQSIAHGVILLEQLNPEYGAERRRLRVRQVPRRLVPRRVSRLRHPQRRSRVFPRLVAAEHRRRRRSRKLQSGIPELDALLGGGIEEGTSTLIVGAAGTGKSTLAAQFAAAAAARGEKSALFMFDESPLTLFDAMPRHWTSISSSMSRAARSASGRSTRPSCRLASSSTPSARRSNEDGVKLVVIDSLNGYLNAMPEERFLTIQLHELLMYLGQRDVATILVGAHQGLIGAQMHHAGRCQLSGRCRDPAALLRGAAAKSGRRFRS